MSAENPNLNLAERIERLERELRVLEDLRGEWLGRVDLKRLLEIFPAFSRSSVFEWEEHRGFPFEKVGGKKLYRPKDVDAWCRAYGSSAPDGRHSTPCGRSSTPDGRIGRAG